MSKTICPHCQRPIKLIPLSGSGGGWERGQSFAMGAPPAGASYEREVPAFDTSGIEAGFKVPALQALLTGLAVGAVALVVAVWRGWAWYTVPAVGVVVFALAWWGLLLSTRGNLKTVERITGQDGPERVAAHEVRVEVTDLSEGKRRMTFARFPAKSGQVLDFAQAAINGQLTTYGRHGLSRRVFSRLRDESISRGLIAWVNPEHRTQGIELTRVGERVFERLLIDS